MPVGAGTGWVWAVDVPMWILAVFITVLNLAVFCIVLGKQKLRTFTNYFVASLAIADAITGALLLPVYSLGPAIVIGYANAITLPCSISNVCAVTYDRYLAIVYPLQYYVIISKRFKPIIVTSWVLPILLSLFPLIYDTNVTLLIHRIYTITAVLVMEIIVPYIFIFIAYCRIFLKLRKQSKNRLVLTGSMLNKKQIKLERQTRSEARVAKLVAVIAFIFFLSWLPVTYMTVSVMVFENRTLIPSSLPIISVFTITLSALINPILYAVLKPDIRKQTLSYIRRFRARFRALCCHWRSNHCSREFPRAVSFASATTFTDLEPIELTIKMKSFLSSQVEAR